jgi:hypothetical protein
MLLEEKRTGPGQGRPSLTARVVGAGKLVSRLTSRVAASMITNGK